MSALASIDDVLAFWFGAAGDSTTVAARQSALWWSKNSSLDADVKTRFGATIAAASSNQLDDWADTPEGMLALILLFDQLPRNSYRDTPQAFVFDALAQQCCHLGLALGFDQQLSLLQRVFFYLPLEHAEDPDDQDLAVHLLDTLASNVAKQEPAAKAIFDNFANYGRRHQHLIQRFGRFPHRNLILARPSTAEEVAFLREPGSSF